MKAFFARIYFGHYDESVYLVAAETKEDALLKINERISEDYISGKIRAELDDVYEITEKVEAIFTGE